MAVERLIREWTLGDVPAVQHVLLATWLDAYASFIPEEDLRTYFDHHYGLHALEAMFHDPGFSGFLAEIDGAVAAVARNQFDVTEHRFYVSSLYVLPEYQGMGLGTALMEAAATRARLYHVHEIWLGVMKQNRPALEWYKGMGFQFVEELPFTMGRTTVAHLIGFKKIAAAASEQ
jgi:ribosomal protein S18 acetylase RimI-like enzyme